MFSSAEVAEIRLQFETQGFVHLKSVIPDAMLRRAKDAFDAASQRHFEEWRKAALAGTGESRFFDIPDILDQDDVFIDLVDLPTIFPLMAELVGDDIQLNHTSARLFYPGPTYTSPFHSDLAHVLGFSHANTLNFMVKVHYFVEDLSANRGCLAFIPGSHRYPANHPKPKHLDETSTAVVKIVPRAGDAVIFNTHVMHMALDNTSDVVRKSIIYAYSHYWMKHYSSAVPSNLERFSSNKQRKQLFGVDEPGVPHFDRRLGLNKQTPSFSTLLSASKRMVKMVLPKRSHVPK
ncbi:MAG: phytanoyl-CoA dioxygenase family protein [Hydrogenophaga sp.]|uniref:phytanoyl-CoA dioxygenase family protein n=1 Tax=Hydrogenophaga sp. TaxID=1904254 RepID=UPI00403552D0